jgi:hypothetical protein
MGGQIKLRRGNNKHTTCELRIRQDDIGTRGEVTVSLPEESSEIL